MLADVLLARFAKPDGLKDTPTPFSPDAFDAAGPGLDIDYGSPMCQAVREVNARNGSARCRKTVEDIDAAMGSVYAANGMWGNVSARRDTVSNDSRSYCKISDNCTHFDFGKPTAFDEIAEKATKYYDTPMAERSEILSDPHILTMFSEEDGDDPDVKGHERKHYHPMLALVNVVYTYARFYKEEFPWADSKEIAEQTRLWFNEGDRKKMLTKESKRIQRELDCVERDYNLGEECYPIEWPIYNFIAPILHNLRNEVRKRGDAQGGRR